MATKSLKGYQRAFVEQYAVASVLLAIADAMEATGVNQRMLARRLGVSEGRVSQLLANNSNPSVKTLARLADALGLKLKLSFAPKEAP